MNLDEEFEILVNILKRRKTYFDSQIKDVKDENLEEFISEFIEKTKKDLSVYLKFMESFFILQFYKDKGLIMTHEESEKLNMKLDLIIKNIFVVMDCMGGIDYKLHSILEAIEKTAGKKDD